MGFFSKTQLFTLFTVVMMIDFSGAVLAAQRKHWLAFLLSALFVPGDAWILKNIYKTSDSRQPDPVLKLS